MTTPSKAEPSFRRIVRANRLIAEGKCPGCEMDYKPKIESLEAELRDTRRALEMAAREAGYFTAGIERLIEQARKERGQ